MARQRLDQMIVRFPDGLRGELKVAAERNRRSMNAEAVFHIERGLAAEANEKGA